MKQKTKGYLLLSLMILALFCYLTFCLTPGHELYIAAFMSFTMISVSLLATAILYKAVILTTEED